MKLISFPSLYPDSFDHVCEFGTVLCEILRPRNLGTLEHWNFGTYVAT